MSRPRLAVESAAAGGWAPGRSSRDPRLRAVKWRDLVQLGRWGVVRELLLPWPWLLASWCFHGLAVSRHWVWVFPALLSSFYFFLAALRQSHDAQHYVLGLPRRATEWVMAYLSVLMLCSLHAIQVTHLHHHAHCLTAEDLEARVARWPWYKVILHGPLYIPWLHWKAVRWAKPRRRRAWIAAELLALSVWVGLVFAALDFPALRLHVGAMVLGHSLLCFFTVWTVHRGCEQRRRLARTQRGRLKNLVACNMFYHVEHHLFPAVPTCHLPELARRLDEAAPELGELSVY